MLSENVSKSFRQASESDEFAPQLATQRTSALLELVRHKSHETGAGQPTLLILKIVPMESYY